MVIATPAESRIGRTALPCKTIDDEIRRQVQLILWNTQPEKRVPERRREKRHPFPYPIQLIPLDSDGRPLHNDMLVVIGRHLSEHGLDFFNPEPVPFRKVIASFSCGTGRVAFLLDLSWCRFTQHGWYENGGRFLHTLPSPLL